MSNSLDETRPAAVMDQLLDITIPRQPKQIHAGLSSVFPAWSGVNPKQTLNHTSDFGWPVPARPASKPYGNPFPITLSSVVRTHGKRGRHERGTILYGYSLGVYPDGGRYFTVGKTFEIAFLVR